MAQRLVSTEPDARLARELRSNIDTRLLKSIDDILLRVEERLQLRVAEARDRIAEASEAIASKNAKIGSSIFAAHSKLVGSIRTRRFNEIPRIVDSLKVAFPVAASPSIDVFPTSQDSTPLSFINELLVAEHADTYGLDVKFCRPGMDELVESEAVCRHVLREIKLRDEDSYNEFCTLISEIRLFQAIGLNAGSSFPIYGCIYLHTTRPSEPWTAYLEHLIHECAHHALFAMWTLDAIVINSADEMFNSPLRLDLRPMSAVFHQMFVLARVIRIWSIFQESGEYGDEIYAGYTNYQNDKDGSNFVEKFWVAARIIEQHAHLTQAGRAILTDCCEAVRHRPVVFHG